MGKNYIVQNIVPLHINSYGSPHETAVLPGLHMPISQQLKFNEGITLKLRK
jgi:hypothetical protein